jgi:hypothetical protein
MARVLVVSDTDPDLFVELRQVGPPEQDGDDPDDLTLMWDGTCSRCATRLHHGWLPATKTDRSSPTGLVFVWTVADAVNEAGIHLDTHTT